jgi:lipoate---protein ligase
MDTWRLLPLETDNAAMNMAIDEAILNARITGQVSNTLRFYRWQPSAVSIGKNQNPENELYLDSCKRLGVDLVRRISGGGTVYHDFDGEVTYCVIGKSSDFGSGDITGVYVLIYRAVTDALRLLGLTADFSSGDAKNCPNLTVNCVVMQHGTLLRSVDLPKMFQLLKLKKASCTQAADIAKNKITSIKNELGHEISPDTVANALTQGFKAMLKIQLEPSTLTQIEKDLANKLYKEKYATKEWNLGIKI